MGKVAAAIARALFGAADAQLNTTVGGNGRDSRVRRLQQERHEYRREIERAARKGKR